MTICTCIVDKARLVLVQLVKYGKNFRLRHRGHILTVALQKLSPADFPISVDINHLEL